VRLHDYCAAIIIAFVPVTVVLPADALELVAVFCRSQLTAFPRLFAAPLPLTRYTFLIALFALGRNYLHGC